MDKITLSRAEFKALASDTRIEMLKLMSKRNYNVSELSKKLSLSGPTIKEHLEKLYGSNLVEPLPGDYKWKYYKLTRKGKRIVEPQEVPVAMILSLSVLAMLAGALLVGFSVQQVPIAGIQAEKAPLVQAQGDSFDKAEPVMASKGLVEEDEALAQAEPSGVEGVGEARLEKDYEVLLFGTVLFLAGAFGGVFGVLRIGKRKRKK